MLAPRASLAIAELVYYAPTIFLASYVAYRHGFGRQRGWLFLIIFAAFRIAGDGITLATIHNSSPTLFGWAAAFSSLGLSTLLLAQHGLICRIFDTMPPNRAIPARIVRLLELLPLIGLILSIIGATKFSSDLNSSRTYLRAATILFLIVFILQAGLCAYAFIFKSFIPHGELILLKVCSAAVPFLLVRTIYSMLASFTSRSSEFSIFSRQIAVKAGMGSAMEFCIVAMFLAAGFIVPVIPRSATVSGKDRQQLDYDDSHLEPQEVGRAELGAPPYEK